MKNNQIYWKTSSADNVKVLLSALKDKYLVIQLVERRPGKKRVTTVRQFDSGMQYEDSEGMEKQCAWVDSNPINNMYQFYVIQS